MKLQSYVSGRWQEGSATGRPLVNAATGAVLATADSTGLDLAAGITHARDKGGAALHAMTFAERGALLKAMADALQAKRADYDAIARDNSGNTKTDAMVDIDGGIFTLRHYARIGSQLGAARRILEAGREQLARDPVFFARHVWTGRPGVSVQINAFNFPSWGLWEKVAVATLAGVPSIAKPATATALLSQRMVADVIAAGVVPEGVLSLVCGGADGLLDGLGPMDSVAFTGSAATGALLRRRYAALDAAPRLTIEADSVNATVLGPDAAPGTVAFDLALSEATKALSVKAGQLCTNIRRILVPEAHAKAFAEALGARVSGLKVGDPGEETTRVGPLINAAQRADALDKIARLEGEAKRIAQTTLPEVAPQSGFVAPTLLYCERPDEARVVHETEVFGPCATIMPWKDAAGAAALAARGEGSLAMSLFSDDADFQTRTVNALACWHGRVLVVDSEVGKAHSGHAIVMPHCVHGGPGRAGGGEELGGTRGLRFHMQRTALQGGPAMLERIAGDAVEAAL